MSEYIGPTLPPGLRSVQNEEKEEEEQAVIGPHKSAFDVSIGPRLPPNLSTAEKQDELDTAASSFCGPSLPPNSVISASDNNSPTTTSARAGSASYGPSLPPGFEIRGEEDSKQSPTNSKIIGPSLPPGIDVTETEGDKGEDEETYREGGDDVIGPMPMVSGVNEAESSIRRRREFESRSKAMKDKLLGKVLMHTPTARCDFLILFFVKACSSYKVKHVTAKWLLPFIML